MPAHLKIMNFTIIANVFCLRLGILQPVYNDRESHITYRWIIICIKYNITMAMQLQIHLRLEGMEFDANFLCAWNELKNDM